MEENNYNSKVLIKNMPAAFAHHRVIFDQNKAPEDYIFIDVNQKFTELTGLKRKDVINKRATEVLADITDGSFNWIQFYGELSLNAGSRTFEKYSKPLGRWYKVQAYSQKEGYFTTIFYDITERKEKEQRLQKMSERLNNIFNNIDDIVWSISWPDLEVKFVSKAVEDIVGYTVQQFKKDPMFLQKITHPEDKKINENAIKDLKEKGYSKREFRVICKDGSIKWIQDRGKIICNQENEPVKVEGVMRDVTEKVKQRKELEMMNFTVDNSDLIIFRVTPAGIIDYVNETVLDKLGYKREEIVGSKAKMIVKTENYVERKKIWNKIKTANSITYQRKFITKSGKVFPVEMTSQYFSYGDREYEFAFVKDITERKKQEEKIKHLSYRDQLTDLHNRRFFEKEIKRLNTKRQLPISIIMADVNGLKIINDSYGHQKGDELLIKTAEILKSSLRAEDVLVRHGGDEFAILLPQTTRREAQKIIKRIKERTENTKQNTIPISIGVGMAVKMGMDENIEDTLKKADNAMYKNKLLNNKSTKNKIIQNLLNTLKTKSSETKEHALRMEKLAHELGEKINLSNTELNRLSLLAALHDIGKTTISKNILNKSGDLTEGEWKIIREHPETGYKIASASDEFALVAEEILYHHEHWDGGGYPKGLAAEEIPFLARIISIVDAYDVMTNDQPYSKAISKKEALAELKDCAGTQFDPDLAEVFIELKSDVE